MCSLSLMTPEYVKGQGKEGIMLKQREVQKYLHCQEARIILEKQCICKTYFMA